MASTVTDPKMRKRDTETDRDRERDTSSEQVLPATSKFLFL